MLRGIVLSSSLWKDSKFRVSNSTSNKKFKIPGSKFKCLVSLFRF
jgi:hypothetical protein